MTVEIPPEHQAFVKDAIARGEFGSETEVVGEALRLLEERERRLAALPPKFKLASISLTAGTARSMTRTRSRSSLSS